MGERSGRCITLIFREYGVRTTVELAPAAAHTAEQTWQHLPRETTPMHGRYSGPEMVTTPGGTRWQARSNGHATTTSTRRLYVGHGAGRSAGPDAPATSSSWGQARPRPKPPRPATT